MQRKARPRPNHDTSVAAQVRIYIDSHPSIKECLASGLLNLSALARRIMDDTGLDQEDAVLVACRRARSATPPIDEEARRKTLARSRVEIASKVAIVTVPNHWRVLERLQPIIREGLKHGRTLRVIQGSQAVTIVTDQHTLATLVKALHDVEGVQIQEDTVEIAVTSPESIRDTPGVMAFLYGALASSGINVLETFSTYTDTIFLVEPDDMMAAFEVLNRCLR